MKWWFKIPVFVTLWAGMIAIKVFPLLVAAPFAAYLDWSWWMYILPIGVAPLGLFVGPILYLYRNTEYKDLPFWTRPWANPEDWLGQQIHYKDGLPRWWYDKKGTGFKSWYRYNIIRNPANGLRSFEFIDLDIDPTKVEFVRSKNFTEERYDISAVRNAELKTVWYFAWQGLQAGFEFIHIWPDGKNGLRHFNIKFGWRVEPSDANPDNHHGIGSNDASFASKVLPYREG